MKSGLLCETLRGTFLKMCLTCVSIFYTSWQSVSFKNSYTQNSKAFVSISYLQPQKKRNWPSSGGLFENTESSSNVISGVWKCMRIIISLKYSDSKSLCKMGSTLSSVLESINSKCLLKTVFICTLGYFICRRRTSKRFRIYGWNNNKRIPRVTASIPFPGKYIRNILFFLY